MAKQDDYLNQSKTTGRPIEPTTRLAKLIILDGRHQYAIAAMAGISSRTLRTYMKEGTGKMTDRVRFALADVLGVDEDDLDDPAP